MSPAEKFAMCMAEAGFAGHAPFMLGGRIMWRPMLEHEGDPRYWEAVWRAGEMANPDERPKCCRGCWVTDHVGNGWSRIGGLPCEHVEVSA